MNFKKKAQIGETGATTNWRNVCKAVGSRKYGGLVDCEQDTSVKGGELSEQNATAASHDISEPVFLTKIFMNPMQLYNKSSAFGSVYHWRLITKA